MDSDLIIGITIAILWVPSLYLIPKHLGTKRQIGWKYSLFFTIVFTWIGGLVLTLISRPIAKQRRVGLNRILGVIGAVGLLNNIYMIEKEKNYDFSNLYVFVGFVVLVVYCFDNSKKIETPEINS
jgi:hypothetical protein